MKLKYLLVHLLALCIGIFLYAYVTEQSLNDAFRCAYFAVCGGVFIWFNMRIK